MSTPEVYEIWAGKAYIYMQETANDQPGRCYAIEGNPGDYGFDYKDVRAHKGLAFFPKVGKDQKITWEKNPNYQATFLEIRGPRTYTELGIDPTKPIYTQYLEDPERFMFVVNPKLRADIWERFIS